MSEQLKTMEEIREYVQRQLMKNYTKSTDEKSGSEKVCESEGSTIEAESEEDKASTERVNSESEKSTSKQNNETYRTENVKSVKNKDTSEKKEKRERRINVFNGIDRVCNFITALIARVIYFAVGMPIVGIVQAVKEIVKRIKQ